MRLLALPVLLVSLLATLALAPVAGASPSVRYGLQDDAWIAYGPGTLDERAAELKALGVRVVRYNLPWREIATRRPATQRSPSDPAYAWGAHAEVLEALRRHGITAMVGIYRTPAWANGGRAHNFAPNHKTSLANFAFAASKRFPWVRHWLIWNEPNQARWLRPTTPRVYTNRLLNPAYRALKQANRRNKVGAGVTAPRGNAGGMNPVRWISGMRAAKARFDAYAHHPYPLSRHETPRTGGCGHCLTITMATLERLLTHVQRNFRGKRIWLTEWGHQTNPPARLLGVAPAVQARYVAEAAHRVRQAPRVDFLIQFLYQDEPNVARWQSGLRFADGRNKPSLRAFRLPLAQVARLGRRTTLWGQVRPRTGRQTYRLQQRRNGAWRWVGPVRTTNLRGEFSRVVNAGRGARFRVWSPRDQTFSPVLRIR